MSEFYMPVVQVARKCNQLLAGIMNGTRQLRSRYARFRAPGLPRSAWRGLPALVFLAAALAAIPATIPAQTVVGTKFSIASGWAGMGAAFDGTNVLVALEGNTSAAKVAAQLVSPSGAKIGSPIALGHDGQSCCAAGVAFDGTNYLVAWEEDQGIKNSWAPLMVYGRFINTSGAQVGQAFAMTTAGITFDGLHMLAYGNGAYLLTYTRLIVPANGDGATNRYVAGRIVSPGGALGNEFRISQGYGSGSSTGFDGTNFFVVWKEDSQDYEVRGRFVSPSGALGQEISINASPAASDYPVLVSFDGANHLVVWTDDAGPGGDVFGQRVSPNGALVGGVITIASEPGMQMSMGIGFDGTNHLVTWVDMTNDGNWDLYGQYVGKDGALVGGKFAINTDAGNQIGGVGCGSGGCLALVSSGIVMGSGGPAQVGELYGAFLTAQVPTTSTTSTSTTTSSSSSTTSTTTAPTTTTTTSVTTTTLYGSAWSNDPAVNNAISTAANNQLAPSIVSDGSGGAIVTWQDLRSGTADIYAQRIGANGVVQWTADGVAIATAANSQTPPSIVSDGSGGAIITWNDLRGDGVIANVYAQRINASGVVQWTADGVTITTTRTNPEYPPKIVSDGIGGAIIAWWDGRFGNSDVYAQRINAAGVVQWTANGVAITPGPANGQEFPAIASDGSGGAIITWQDNRNNNNGISDIYAQRIDANGSVQWTANGVAISTAANIQSSPAIVSDGSGGAIITWNDLRGDGVIANVYAQRIDASGIVQWTADGVAITTERANPQYSPRIVSDGSGGAIITWWDGRFGNSDVYAQRINAAGAVQWTANGVAITPSAANGQEFPAITSDGSGGAVITWQDNRNNNNAISDIYAQRIDANGVVQSPSDGVAISRAANIQSAPAIVSDGSGGAIVTWEDRRSDGTTSDIYAQHINANGTLGVVPGATTTTTSSSTSTTTTSSTTTTTLGGTGGPNFIAGWNLVGNSIDANLDVATAFGDTAKVTTVWKWVASSAKWAFYAPSLIGQALIDYATSKGYDVLSTIAGGEAFWVNSKGSFTATLPAGNAIGSDSFQDPLSGTGRLVKGWNLIAIGDNKTPSEFNKALSATPPDPGVIPLNVTTLWAWDSTLSNWYFYAPSLEKSGGLGAYISSKSYLDFGTKVLDPTMGFWVNKP